VIGHPKASLSRMTVLVALLCPGSASTSPITPTSSEASARTVLGSKIPGAQLLWVRSDKIYHSTVSNFTEQLVTQGSYAETNPRWSPDGKQILFVRSSDGVYVMKSDFSGQTKVIPGGHTASWTRDGKSITAVDSTGYKVLQYDLAAKTTKTIYDAQQSPYNGQKVSQAAELRTGGRYLLVFRLTPTHVTEIVDLQTQKYISNTEMERGDCSPAWAPDGSYIVTTARTSSRPVLKTVFHPATSSAAASVDPSKHFVGLDTSEKFYIHGQRVSNDGKYVTFGGKIFAGPKANGDREIYIWKIGEPEANAVRMTFETNEDKSPSLYIPPAGTTPKLALSPTSLAFSATEGGSNPGSKTVTVGNSGGGTLATITTSVTYGSGSGWLAANAGGSGNSQSVANSVDISGLSPNTYSATVKVSSSNASNSPQSYIVSLTVKEKPEADAGVAGDGGGVAAPKLSLNPTLLTFAAQAGGADPKSQTVAVTNAGGGTLKAVSTSVSYTSGSNWLSVTSGGSANAQSIDNSVATSGLAPNTYMATVEVTEPNAANSPQSYTVSLTISETPPPDGGPTADSTAAGDGSTGILPEAGTTGDGVVSYPLDEHSLEGGCGCGVPGSTPGGPAAWAWFLLALILAVWRSRR
jgi:MYXO-CTERM domain-containing protein